MNLTEYIKMNMKKRIPQLRISAGQASTAQRALEMQNSRRESRHSLLSKRRRLQEVTLTPIISPLKSIKKEKKELKVDKRKVMLKQWQENKAKLKAQQKAQSKPTFKVFRISQSLDYNKNLSKAIGEIKGKPIQAVHKIAPSSTHKFKPPANIKPIHFNIPVSKLEKDASLKPFANLRTKLKFEEQRKKPAQQKKNVFVDKITHVEVKIEMPININILQKENVEPSNDQNLGAIVTPKVSKDGRRNSSTYLSPYITVSRGKTNARKEYEKKINGEASEDGSSPKSAAIYFTKLLEVETDRLKIMCKNWNDYKNDEQPPEEVCDMINVATGQTELLINKKFKQFRSLIESCSNGESEKPITAFDLQGFWDTALLQVKNLDKRFENLDTLKSNNWEEILPVAKPKSKSGAPSRKVKKAVASSGLMAAIRDGRKKQQQVYCEPVDVVISTPNHRRKSLRIALLSSASKCKTCSPDIIEIQRTPRTNTIKTPAQLTLPTSILKSGSKSFNRNDLRKSKTVLFADMDNGGMFDRTNEKSRPSVVEYICTPRRSDRILNKLQK